jgi:choline dehydrogenase-like flavoprotein
VHVTLAEKSSAKLYPQTTATKVDVDPDRRIPSIHFKRWDGSEGKASGRVFVLAAHGIEIPRLLLNSRSEAMPQGVANSSDQVGRNLMDHPAQLSWALAPEDRCRPLVSRISATEHSAKTGLPSASSWAMTVGRGPKVRPQPRRQILRGSVCATPRSTPHCVTKPRVIFASPRYWSNRLKIA